MTDTPKPTPAIRVEASPFGEFTDEQLAGDPSAPDRFYLKGYSDKRHLRELDVREGKVPQALTHRFQYVSVESDDARPTKNKLVEWKAKGYRPVMFDELASLGIDAAESTVEKGPEGHARVGTQLLMVIDAAGAARHYKKQRADTARQFEAVKNKLDSAVENYNVKHGRPADATKALHEEKVFEQ